jgi:hypothetical protein
VHVQDSVVEAADGHRRFPSIGELLLTPIPGWGVVIPREAAADGYGTGRGPGTDYYSVS